jgi:uncharacterized protein (DUF2164 family)
MTEQEKQSFIKKINYTVINEYEIEITYFDDGQILTFWKDLSSNRCYKETGTKNPRSKIETVKERIKNSVFDEILKSCKIIDKRKQANDAEMKYIEIDFKEVKGI